MASFTTKGQTVELRIPAKNEIVNVAISGTYDQVIDFQIEQGSPGSGSYQTIQRFDTEDATEAFEYLTQDNDERLRLLLVTDDGGTAVVTLTNTSVLNLDSRAYKAEDGSDLITFDQAGAAFPGDLAVAGDQTITGDLVVTGGVSQADSIVSHATSDLVLTAALHAGKTVVLNLAAGIAVVLPEATGTGDKYTLVVGITFTSAASIVTDSAADDMIGTAVLFVDGGATVEGYAAVAGNDTVDLLGTANSTGGIAGATYEFIDIADTLWLVRLVSDAGGTEATPFSTAA
jgi:hypothetical protein